MCKKEVNKHVVCEKGLITVFWVYFIGKLRLYAKDVNNSFGCPLEEEEFEDTKGVIRIRKSKNNRQHNGQKKKYKRTNNDLQNIKLKIE